MSGDAFGKFKASLNRGVTAISIKTSSSLEKVKIKTHIDSIRTEIDKMIVSAGQAAYALWEKGESDYSAIYEQFAVIKQKKEEIVRLESEYDAIDERDNQILGINNSEDTAPAAEAEDADASIVCPSCGSVYSDPVRFCRKCGQKLSE